MHPGPDKTAALLQEHAVRVRELDTATGAFDQCDAELGFELAKLNAQRGLSDAQAFRCSAEMQLLGEGDKAAEVTKLDAFDLLH